MEFLEYEDVETGNGVYFPKSEIAHLITNDPDPGDYKDDGDYFYIIKLRSGLVIKLDVDDFRELLDTLEIKT